MKITVTVDSFEELFKLSEELQKMNLQREIGIASIEGQEEKPKKAEKPEPVKVEKPKKEEVEPVKEEETVDVDALKVEVRKLLTKVNKQTGKNQAKEWIKNLGHDSLTEVEELDDLNALKALAEEELSA
mgnify:CR=1 FL=1